MKISQSVIVSIFTLLLSATAVANPISNTMLHDCQRTSYKYKHVTLFNSDISIRGGLYSLDESQGFYVTNMHVLRGSNFALNKEQYAVYGVQINGSPTNSLLWLDIAFVVDLSVYPLGIKDPRIEAITRKLSHAQESIVNSVQAVCVTHITQNNPKIATSVGIYDPQNAESIIRLFEEDSLIKPGSSGGIVSTIVYDINSQKSFQPHGVLVCEQEESSRPGQPIYQKYKIISFDFLKYPETFEIHQFNQMVPESVLYKTCTPINGRNLGG